MAKTATKRGLTVFAAIIDQVFATKRKVAENFKQTMTICFDTFLPQWNYRLLVAQWSYAGFSN